MKTLSRKVYLLLFALPGVCIRLCAVDNLRLADMRSLGIGGNGVTQSVLFNPALLVGEKNKTIHLEYFNRFGIKELGTICTGFYYPGSKLSTGVDISSFGYDKYRESMFRISLGKRVGKCWQIGISIQYYILQTEVIEEQPQQLAADLGILYTPVDNLFIGMLIMNFPSVGIHSKSVDIKEFNRYSIQIGFQWNVINSLLIAGTLETNRDVTLTGNVGIEYKPFNNFSLRAGIQTVPFLPTLGVGYKFSRIGADITTVWHPVLGISSGIGLKFTF